MLSRLYVVLLLGAIALISACTQPAENGADPTSYPFTLVSTNTAVTDLEGTWFVEQWSEGVCYGTRIQFKGDLYWYDLSVGCSVEDLGNMQAPKGGWIEFQGHTNTPHGVLATQFTLIASSDGDTTKSGDEVTFYNIYYIDTVNHVLYMGNDPALHLGDENTTEENRPYELILSEPYYPIEQSFL